MAELVIPIDRMLRDEEIVALGKTGATVTQSVRGKVEQLRADVARLLAEGCFELKGSSLRMLNVVRLLPLKGWEQAEYDYRVFGAGQNSGYVLPRLGARLVRTWALTEAGLPAALEQTLMLVRGFPVPEELELLRQHGPSDGSRVAFLSGRDRRRPLWDMRDALQKQLRQVPDFCSRMVTLPLSQDAVGSHSMIIFVRFEMVGGWVSGFINYWEKAPVLFVADDWFDGGCRVLPLVQQWSVEEKPAANALTSEESVRASVAETFVDAFGGLPCVDGDGRDEFGGCGLEGGGEGKGEDVDETGSCDCDPGAGGFCCCCTGGEW
jgi:hypothetical protein